MKTIIINLLDKFGVLIAFFASVLSILAFFNLFSQSKLELTVDTRSVQNTSMIPSLYNLQASFVYKDKLVKNLEIAEIEFKNTGQETIIGEGSRSNVIKNALNFSVPDNYKILAVTDFDNWLPIEISKSSDRTFEIKVSQVRKGENFYVIVYAEKLREGERSLHVYNHARDLIDGRIIDTESYKARGEVNRLYSMFGYKISSVLIFLGIASLVASFLLYLALAASVLVSKLRIWRSQYNNSNKSIEFEKEVSKSQAQIKNISASQDRLIWSEFPKNDAKNLIATVYNSKLTVPLALMFVSMAVGSLAILLYVFRFDWLWFF